MLLELRAETLALGPSQRAPRSALKHSRSSSSRDSRELEHHLESALKHSQALENRAETLAHHRLTRRAERLAALFRSPLRITLESPSSLALKHSQPIHGTPSTSWACAETLAAHPYPMTASLSLHPPTSTRCPNADRLALALKGSHLLRRRCPNRVRRNTRSLHSKRFSRLR